MCRMLLKEKLSGVELYFEGKPSKEVLSELKENGYRWNGKKVCWYAKQNNETLEVANKLSGSVIEVAPVENKEVKKNNTIDLFELTTFKAVQREINHNTKEIAKEIRTHVKKRFPFVKFSINTKGYNSINCDILSSPFEKDSIYLKAIQEYCKAFTDSFNYNNSDMMTDYFDVNFYGGYFQTSYNYEQVEATEEIIEAMKNFDIKMEELKKEAKEIEEVFNNVIEKNYLDDWYNTRRIFVNELRKNVLLNFSKESVQQVQEEKIKDYMYKTLKEVDRVEDQFNDNKLRIGEKLTLIKESMIGGASASHIIFNGYEEIEGYNGKKSIKVTLGVEGKKGLYSTTIGNDKVLIYKGWLDIPASVLYEDTSNEYFTGTQTKFGSYDTKALDEIINHLECEGNYPIINTYKPLF